MISKSSERLWASVRACGFALLMVIAVGGCWVVKEEWPPPFAGFLCWCWLLCCCWRRGVVLHTNL